MPFLKMIQSFNKLAGENRLIKLDVGPDASPAPVPEKKEAPIIPISAETVEKMDTESVNEGAKKMKALKIEEARNALPEISEVNAEIKAKKAELKEEGADKVAIGKELEGLDLKKKDLEAKRLYLKNVKKEGREKRDTENPPKTKAEAAKRAMDDATEDMQDPALTPMEKLGAMITFLTSGMEYIQFSIKDEPYEKNQEAATQLAEAERGDNEKIKQEAKDEFVKEYLVAGKGGLVTARDDLDKKTERNTTALSIADRAIKSTKERMANGITKLNELSDKNSEEAKELVKEIQLAEKTFNNALKSKEKAQRGKKVIEEQKRIVSVQEKQPGVSTGAPYKVYLTNPPNNITCPGEKLFLEFPNSGYTAEGPNNTKGTPISNSNIIALKEGDSWEIKKPDGSRAFYLNFKRGLKEETA